MLATDKITKQDTLKWCMRLWKWLMETGAKLKREWPGWIYNGGRIHRMIHNCPCCSYVEKDGWINCAKCPLVPIWKHPVSNYQDAPCNKPGSPFYKWKNAKTTDERKKHAKVIFEGARELHLKNTTNIVDDVKAEK